MDESQRSIDAVPAGTPRRSFHFTIRSLFVCTFGVAFGLAESRRGIAPFSDGFFAALSAWAAMGLGQQARDLWRHFRNRDDLTREQRWGVRFAFGWRVGVVLLWSAYYVGRECQHAGLLPLPELADTSVWFDVNRELRTALIGLLLLIAAGPCVQVACRRSSLGDKVKSGLGIVAGAMLALLLYWDQMTITFLVHVACEGIDAARTLPYRAAPLADVPSLAERYQPFVCGSAVALCLGVFNLILLWRLAANWSAFRRAKMALFAIGVLLLCSVEYWLVATAFPKACPYLATRIAPRPSQDWILAAIVMGVAFTASTFRLCARSFDSHGGMDIAWRASRIYPHERTYWIILLAVAAIGAIIEDAMMTHNSAGWDGIIVRLFLNGAIYEPRNMLCLTLFLLAWGAPCGGDGPGHPGSPHSIHCNTPSSGASLTCSLLQ